MRHVYLARYHGLGIDEAIREVRAVRPNAMTVPGYEPRHDDSQSWNRREWGSSIDTIPQPSKQNRAG